MKKTLICALMMSIVAVTASAKELTKSQEDAVIAGSVVGAATLFTAPWWGTALYNKHEYGTFLTPYGTLFKAYYGRDGEPVTRMDYYKTAFSRLYNNNIGLQSYLTRVTGDDPLSELEDGDILVYYNGFYKHSFIFIYDGIGNIENEEGTPIKMVNGRKLDSGYVSIGGDDRVYFEIGQKVPVISGENDFYTKIYKEQVIPYDKFNTALKTGFYKIKDKNITATEIQNSFFELKLEPYHQLFSNCQTCAYSTIKNAEETVKSKSRNLEANKDSIEQEAQNKANQIKSQELVEEQENANISEVNDPQSNNQQLAENEEIVPNSDLDLESVAKNNIKENENVEGSDDMNDPDKVGGKDDEILEGFAE